MIDANGDLDVSGSDACTALYAAAASGHTGIVSALTAAGATIDCYDTDGASPLFMAAGAGHLDCVNALLAANADPDLQESTNGATALWSAANVCPRPPYFQYLHEPLSRGNHRVLVSDPPRA